MKNKLDRYIETNAENIINRRSLYRNKKKMLKYEKIMRNDGLENLAHETPTQCQRNQWENSSDLLRKSMTAQRWGAKKKYYLE